MIDRGNLNTPYILRSFFPTYSENNWYLNCYLIFYALHSVLNKVITSLNRKELFRLSFFSFCLYYVGVFFGQISRYWLGIGTTAFQSTLLIWIVLYINISYITIYEPKIIEDKKFNWFIALIGLSGFFGLILTSNILGLRMDLFSNALQIWNVTYNPFIVLFVFGFFNLARLCDIRSNIINYISKLSMFIYIVHENKIIRAVYRPMVWTLIIERYGNTNLLLWVIVFAVGLTLLSTIASALYFETVHKSVVSISNHMYFRFAQYWHKVENILLND